MQDTGHRTQGTGHTIFHTHTGRAGLTAYAPRYKRRHGHAQAAEEHGVGELQISEDVLVEQDERRPEEHVQGANEYCFGVIHQVDLCVLRVGADGVKHSPALVLSLGLVFVPVPTPDSTF